MSNLNIIVFASIGLLIIVYLYNSQDKYENYLDNDGIEDNGNIGLYKDIYHNNKDDKLHLNIYRNIDNRSYPYPYPYPYKWLDYWWNSSRHTKNMSYDLRGDITPSYMGLWMNT